MLWNRGFDDPVPLRTGKQLATHEEAARYIQRLPKAEQQLPHWQLAVEALIKRRGPRFPDAREDRRATSADDGKPRPTVERGKAYRIVK
jgi:hypothetical protein